MCSNTFAHSLPKGAPVSALPLTEGILTISLSVFMISSLCKLIYSCIFFDIS